MQARQWRWAPGSCWQLGAGPTGPCGCVALLAAPHHDHLAKYDRGPSQPLAERAVDGDFSQGSLENGEFLIAEPPGEQFRHTAKMDRRSFGHACDAGVGQGDNHAAPVLSGVRPAYETLVSQPGDAAGQPR